MAGFRKDGGTRGKMLVLLDACAFYVRCDVHPTRRTLARYTNIQYNSIGVYMSWLRRLKLVAVVGEERQRVQQEYAPTELGQSVMKGFGGLYVWQDFMWTMVENKVVTMINYKGSRGKFVDALEAYLRSSGTVVFPDPRLADSKVKHRPTLFPADMPGTEDYNRHIKVYLRNNAMDEKPRGIMKDPATRPMLVLAAPPAQPQAERPPAVTPVALANGQTVLVVQGVQAQAVAPELTLPPEPSQAVVESVVRMPTREMLMGGKAPRRWKQ